MYDKTFQAKIVPTLKSIFEDALSDIWNGKFYWQVKSPTSSLPVGIYQFQDGGGRRDDTIGANGWTGLITFRALSNNDNDNWLALAEVAERLELITHPEYDISSVVENPIPFPVDRTSSGNVYTAGLIVRFYVKPK